MAEARAPDWSDMYSRQGLQIKNGGVTLSANGYIKGGQTAYNTGTGFYLGYSGTTYKFSIGNPSGNQLTWDGVTLTVKGTIALGSSVAWADVAGAGKPSDNADVTLSVINGGLSVTGGGLTLSGGGSIKGGKTDYASGTGFFLGYSGGAYKFDIGSSTSYLRWTGTALSIIGDIDGVSNINITGNARFKGAYTGAVTSAAIYCNESNTADTGVFGQATVGSGVHGYGTSNAIGVTGVSAYIGVSGVTSSSTNAGVRGNNTSTGPSVECMTIFKWGTISWAVPGNTGYKFLLDNGSWSSIGAISSGASTGTSDLTNKPGSNSTSVWLTLNIGGTLYDVQAYPR